MTKPSAREAAFRATIPVFFGMFPLGAAFGLLFNTLGHPWYYAVLSSVFVFAGASQFLSVGLLAAHAGLASIFVATLFVNLRHAFYGFSLTRRFPQHGWRRWYMIFALTDEGFSLLTARKPPAGERDEEFGLWVLGLLQAYWVAGTVLGALLGSRVHFDTKGFDFVLTALFVVLTVEQMLAVKKVFPFALAVAAAAVALAVVPGQMLVTSLAIVFVVQLLIAEFGGESHG